MANITLAEFMDVAYCLAFIKEEKFSKTGSISSVPPSPPLDLRTET
jgi:hypothetical protein